MSLTESISELAKHVRSQNEYMTNEEAVRNASVEPFIRLLGFCISNLREVFPEYRVGEKNADYAILHNDKPVIVIETKKATNTLGKDDWEQLAGYFIETKARYGILTNGHNFNIYLETDPGVMSKDPFLVIDLYEFREEMVSDLQHLTKSYLDDEHAAALRQRWRKNTGSAIPVQELFEYPIHAIYLEQRLEAWLVVDSVMNWHKEIIHIRFKGELMSHTEALSKAVHLVNPNGKSSKSAWKFWRFMHPETGEDLPIREICEDVQSGGDLKKLLWHSILQPSGDCMTVVGFHADQVLLAELVREGVEQGNKRNMLTVRLQGKWLTTKGAAIAAIQCVDPAFAGTVKNGLEFWHVIDPDDGKLQQIRHIASKDKPYTDEALRQRILAFA